MGADMASLAPTFTVTRDDARREVHYALTGLFTIEAIDRFFEELRRVAGPFMEDRKGFRAIGDLRQYSVQPRDVAERMQMSQDISAKVGVTKMAIVYSSVLQMQQLRRVSNALDMGYFTEMAEALDWLRKD
ncbi:SpoIIAA-like [Erythrobacter litoralis]|jgi:hypothetical protein|uniref:STAS/SEC14 domain-containing protein n=2 Tax=Erythrobacter/Porphyrobacter group TaxID=2800788 RepID=A0A074MGX2_9SPHN|nr:SpoIIAA-like [Erythrobacter litoralis]KEO92719.1 hypothetical protein EH32_15800 [Erythrobacter litoralis]